MKRGKWGSPGKTGIKSLHDAINTPFIKEKKSV